MIRLQFKLKIDYTEQDIISVLERELKIKSPSFSFKIVKESLDARKKDNIHKLVTVDVKLNDERTENRLLYNSHGKITLSDAVNYEFVPKGRNILSERPVVVGCGPAGLFAGYMLAKYGYRPLVIERGASVPDREEKVRTFWNGGPLDTETNVQFGEGGAGTFSDGKLNTGVKDRYGRIGFVLDTFVKYGADPKIAYVNKPHIGTDVLKNVVKNMREAAIAYGAEFRFNTKLTDIQVSSDNRLKGIILENGEIIPTEVLILAPGHSARDTFKMLSEKPVIIENKSFAIGLRIEHLQEKIGKSQYGDIYKLLPAADYKLTGESGDGRGVYSFCMCPGGFVVNASSERGKTCVNGMSNSGRNEKNANAAIVVQVDPSDFEKEGFSGPLGGIRFQQKWEEETFRKASGKIPVQRFVDYVDGIKTTSFGDVLPNSKGAHEMSDLSGCLPSYVKCGIIKVIRDFERKITGYSDPDAILSGVETRTSSPIRIVRDEMLESSVSGLYPCGEGAGYAGGITSAAVDGIKVFEAIANKYRVD